MSFVFVFFLQKSPSLIPSREIPAYPHPVPVDTDYFIKEIDGMWSPSHDQGRKWSFFNNPPLPTSPTQSPMPYSESSIVALSDTSAALPSFPSYSHSSNEMTQTHRSQSGKLMGYFRLSKNPPHPSTVDTFFE